MSDSERRLRGLLSQKRMTNQLLRERKKTPQVAPGRVLSPDFNRVPAPSTTQAAEPEGVAVAPEEDEMAG